MQTRRMYRSVAILSDVHGVLPALDAVLDEPDVKRADLVVVTGDHAAGPQPVEVLRRLQSLGQRVLLVRGNADRDVVALARGEWTSEAEPFEVDAWAAAQLSPAYVQMLAELPHPASIDVQDYGNVVFCHGTPRDDDEVVLVDTRIDRWREAFNGLAPEVRAVFCGHTHMPFIRLVDRRWVVNTGSVGMPYGSTGVPWALLSHEGVFLRSTRVNIEQIALEVVAASTFPGVEDWVNQYILNPAGDADALSAFGPRDGRTG